MRVVKLTVGAGNGVDKACLMTAANMLIGKGEYGDDCSCVCPIIRRFVIRTNDAIGSFSEELLGELYTPLIWELLGTKADLETEIKRGFYFADRAVRLFTPIHLKSVGDRDAAKKLRDMPEIVDRETAESATATAYAAATATATAYAAAAATAAAAAAATATATAYAAAAATAAAAAAAAAADAATAYAAAKEKCFRRCPEVILGAIAIGDRRPVETVCSVDDLAEVLV